MSEMGQTAKSFARVGRSVKGPRADLTVRASSNVRLVGQDGPGSAGHDQPSGANYHYLSGRHAGLRKPFTAIGAGRRGADWDSWKQRYCRQSLIIFPDAPVCYWRGGLLRWATNSPRHRKGLEKGPLVHRISRRDFL